MIALSQRLLERVCSVPELPEVETVVRDLRPRLVGRTITAIRVGRKRLRRPWSPSWRPLLLGERVGAVRRRGKWIILELAGGSCLVVHLGMTGQFLVTPACTRRADHTHLVFRLDEGADELRFRDIRRFGSATAWPSLDEVERFFSRMKLGPEPFDLDARAWHKSLASTDRCLKAVLLDQRVVAGVGNIYADEALFEARLPPGRRASGLSRPEAERLRHAMVLVLKRGIARRGSSIRNYVGGSGRKGSYQEEFRAYGRTGKPCPRCRQAIVCVRLAGRATHYCPKCQREKG